MTFLLDHFRSPAPEAEARRRFAVWSLAALLGLLPFWWMIGADLAAAALRPFVGLVLGLFGLSGVIDVLPDGDWSVGTNLTASGQAVAYTVSRESVRRLLLGVPLVVAFLVAPPRPTRLWRALLIALAVMAVLFALSLTGLVWGQLAAQLDPDLASSGAPAALALDQPPLHPIAAQIALMTRYMGLSILPLATAAILWATLSPQAFSALVADMREIERPGEHI